MGGERVSKPSGQPSRMEADAFSGRERWRCQERPQFFIDIAQSGVVKEQRFVNFGHSLQNGRIGRELLPHFHEGADDIDAHRNCAIASKNVCDLKRTVLGERLGRLGAAWCGHRGLVLISHFVISMFQFPPCLTEKRNPQETEPCFASAPGLALPW
jgi:hypothetical protein